MLLLASLASIMSEFCLDLRCMIKSLAKHSTCVSAHDVVAAG